MVYKESCTQTILPSNPIYFKEEDISEILYIPPQKPSIEKLLDVLVWPELKDVKAIKTIEGTSEEGQVLTGVKLIVELKMNEKITYVANDTCQSVHSAHFEDLKSISIILPREIDGRDVCDLVNANRVNIVPYVESVYGRMIDERTIHKCVLIFVDVKIC